MNIYKRIALDKVFMSLYKFVVCRPVLGLFKTCLSGEFVISSVLSRRDKNLKQRMDQCYSSVLFKKERKIHNWDVRACWPKRLKEKRGTQPNFRSSFYVFSPPPGPALCKRGKSEVQFVLPEVLTSVLRPLFVLFFQAFPFLVFQTPPFWTPFFYSNYLTFPPSRDGRPNSLGVGVSRYLCLLPAELGQQGALGLPSCYSQAWVLIVVSI